MYRAYDNHYNDKEESKLERKLKARTKIFQVLAKCIPFVAAHDLTKEEFIAELEAFIAQVKNENFDEEEENHDNLDEDYEG